LLNESSRSLWMGAGTGSISEFIPFVNSIHFFNCWMSSVPDRNWCECLICDRLGMHRGLPQSIDSCGQVRWLGFFTEELGLLECWVDGTSWNSWQLCSTLDEV
jgi:hypothetical protein